MLQMCLGQRFESRLRGSVPQQPVDELPGEAVLGRPEEQGRAVSGVGLHQVARKIQ